ncbi:MAG: RHS repeat-associated core domain-containing protein [Cellulomonadaceae bacterium]|nr:RHS repeat-associated core domain-containing protein [Cellulomonadaceae bacterium]
MTYAVVTTGETNPGLILGWDVATNAQGASTRITTTTLTLDSTGRRATVATTFTIPNTNPTQITSIGEYDEYGNTLKQGPNTGPLNYGWQGIKERATNTLTGLIYMGARLYNPTTGHFTSPDPITGGNTTPYTYPQNPINSNDLDGLIAWAKIGKGIQKGAKWLTDSKAGKAINIACGFTFGVVSAACTGVYASAYLVRGRYQEMGTELIVAAAGGATKNIIKAAGKAAKGKWITAVKKKQPVTRKMITRYDRAVKNSAAVYSKAASVSIKNKRK